MSPELLEIWTVIKGKQIAELRWGESTIITYLPAEHARELEHAASQHNAIIGRICEELRRMEAKP